MCVPQDESIDLTINLNIDKARSDERIRGTAQLPYSTGKSVRVAVFARDELADAARQAGADVVGAEDLVEEIMDGRLDFERAFATPDVMPALAKAARKLGPKGLMPNPKRGTVFSADDLEANHVAVDVEMSNWRNVSDPPSLRDDNFTLRKIRAVESNADFADADYLKRFYKRVEKDVREAVGCDRVVVFDHTLRVSGVEGLNSLDGKSAAGAVIRVHGDYTTVSGPIRLQKLLDEGAVDRKPSKRFAFVNTWQSIDNDHPILSHPLALCRPRSLDYSKNTWQYYMHYESRVGQNLAVEGRQDQHEWGYYPKMTTNGRSSLSHTIRR